MKRRDRSSLTAIALIVAADLLALVLIAKGLAFIARAVAGCLGGTP